MTATLGVLRRVLRRPVDVDRASLRAGGDPYPTAGVALRGWVALA